MFDKIIFCIVAWHEVNLAVFEMLVSCQDIYHKSSNINFTLPSVFSLCSHLCRPSVGVCLAL